jgi:hypothetical protein
MNDTPTPTPETDAAKRRIAGMADEWVPRYVSEHLERELAEARDKWETACRVGGERIAAERALADRLAGALSDLWHHYDLTTGAYDAIESALAAWKEARKS